MNTIFRVSEILISGVEGGQSQVYFSLSRFQSKK